MIFLINWLSEQNRSKLMHATSWPTSSSHGDGGSKRQIPISVSLHFNCLNLILRVLFESNTNCHRTQRSLKVIRKKKQSTEPNLLWWSWSKKRETETKPRLWGSECPFLWSLTNSFLISRRRKLLEDEREWQRIELFSLTYLKPKVSNFNWSFTCLSFLYIYRYTII